jgi:hypothetical protein
LVLEIKVLEIKVLEIKVLEIKVLEIKVLEIKVLESPAKVDLPKVPRKVQQEPQAQAEAVNLSGAKRR